MSKKSSKSLKIILSIIGGLLGLCIFVCLGLYVLGMWAESNPSVQATGTARAATLSTVTPLDTIAPASTSTLTPMSTVTVTFTNLLPSTPTAQISQIETTSSATKSSSTGNLTLLSSLDDFESSQFCKTYKCKVGESWELKQGGINHTYETNLTPEVSVEVSTLSDKPVDFGLVFYYREMLDIDDLQFIYSFLQAIQPGAQIDETIKNYIEQGVKNDVFQICLAEPAQFGLLKIWAGKVIEQTISVGDSCPQ